MNMNLLKKMLIPVIAFIFIQMIISCNEKKDNAEIKKKNISRRWVEKSGDQIPIKFTINFPDTVYVNQSNDGVVAYESILDSVTTSFGDKNKNRYTRFILTTSHNIDYDSNYLKKHVRDTFGALNNRTIPFYDIKFKKRGTYYIDGFINDLVTINLFKKDKEGDSIFRLLKYDERVTKKVVVINKQ